LIVVAVSGVGFLFADLPLCIESGYGGHAVCGLIELYAFAIRIGAGVSNVYGIMVLL
jgi:hypothetical protein